PSTTTSPGDPLTDVEPQRSGDGALESAEPAPPPHLDLVAPGDDVALDGGRRERERVPGAVGLPVERDRVRPQQLAAPERRLAVVADAEVRAPDLLAVRQHLEPADAA